MGLEIERKFLVCGDFPKKISKHIKQGYIEKSLGYIQISENYLVLSDNQFLHKIDIGLDSKEILDKINCDEEGKLLFSNTEVARIRINNNEGTLTIKCKTTLQGTPEFEYSLPLFCAQYFLKKLTNRKNSLLY